MGVSIFKHTHDTPKRHTQFFSLINIFILNFALNENITPIELEDEARPIPTAIRTADPRMYAAVTAVALLALLATGTPRCGPVADAFRPPLHLGRNPVRKFARLALRALDENRPAPSSPAEASPPLSRNAAADGGEIDQVASALNAKLEQVEGTWYSDDFYGSHGREWVRVSAALTASGAAAAKATKITGDANVPAGCVTWRTAGWPAPGGGDVPAEVQVRADPGDPDGFSWVGGRLGLVARDRIVLSARFSPSFEARGTFHRLNKEEEGS